MVFMHKNSPVFLYPFIIGMSLETIYVYCVKIISQILWCYAQNTDSSFSTISKICDRDGA